ncbi:Flp pilus assembly protein CpaB [Methylotuvimicrobium sp. KM1]|uniref:Flp pilus assembly protein CpaB n=1 Tax=Methylotuvimicrobium sp. KM1 TaxID=3377707 RepID=UPI00384CC491
MSSTVLRVLALLLAIGAIAIGYFGYRASQHQPPNQEVVRVEAEEPKGEAVVFAARDIPAGQAIVEDDLTTSLVPTRPVRSYATGIAIVGRRPRVDIATGEMLMSGHFPTYSQLALSLHHGERAVAVKVDEVTGTGGFIEPGDHVDVLLYLRADRETGPNSSAQVVLTDVRVLAFGNMLQSPDQHSDEDGGRQPETSSGGIKAVTGQSKKVEPTGKKSKTAVLAVAVSDASILMLAESGGKIRLALRGVQQGAKVSASAEVGANDIDYSYAESEQDPQSRYYRVLSDLLRPGSALSTAHVESISSRDQGSIVVHRGSSIETLTLGR